MASITKRTRKGGALSWGVRVRVVGHGTLTKTFRTKLEAQVWATRMEASAKGRTLAVARSTSLGDLLDEYEPKAAPSTRKLLPYWRAALGDVLLKDVNAVMIDRQRDKLLNAPTRSFGQKGTRPRSGSTVRTYLSALSSAFTFGIKHLHWLDSNPCAQVAFPPPSRERKRFLSDPERKALLDACSDHPTLYAAVLIAVTTGIRRGEMYRLRWPDIDKQRRWAILSKTKNGDSRGVALTLPVLAALAVLPRDPDDDRVFRVDLTKAFHTALKRAEIEDFRWHDLRHSAASQLAMNGASHVEIASLLGHRTLAMVRRYAHVANSHTVSLVDRVMGEVQ